MANRIGRRFRAYTEPFGIGSVYWDVMAESKTRELFRKVTRCKSQGSVWTILVAAFLISFYFAYLLVRIDPRLIYQSQEPVFFFDRHFYDDFLSYPGGLNELIARFLSQFFYYAWTGASLLVIVFAFVSWNTWLLVRSTSPNKPILYLHWIPSVILLTLHSNYDFPLVLTLGLLWTLLSVNIYIRFVPSRIILRLLLFLILQATLYYVTAGQVFVFSFIVILHEILRRRKIRYLLPCALFAALLPYVGVSTLFVVRVRDAYTMHLTSYKGDPVDWLSWGLYALFPLMIILGTLEQRYAKVNSKKISRFWETFLYRRSIRMRLLQGIIFLLLLAASVLYGYDKKEKALLLVDHYARFGQWDKVLDMAQKGLPIDNIVQCQVNRALYHSGLLCDRMFSIAQLYGDKGLFILEGRRAAFALQHSDVFFDLGLINESEHWAHEAIAVKGDTAWNLQRLALVNLVKQKHGIAEKYLAMLRKTLWHQAWAVKYQECLAHKGDVWTHPEFQYLQGAMPASNFLVSPTKPELCLDELINNPKNKMAFEYFMAHCLLEGEIGRFINHLHRMSNFDYPRIPRHFEEAMLIYNQITGSEGISLAGRSISQETIRKFQDFNRIRAEHHNNKEAAYEDLKKYRDTYWFYGLYYHQPGES
jgi:hypothetical protein